MEFKICGIGSPCRRVIGWRPVHSDRPFLRAHSYVGNLYRVNAPDLNPGHSHITNSGYVQNGGKSGEVHRKCGRLTTSPSV